MRELWRSTRIRRRSAKDESDVFACMALATERPTHPTLQITQKGSQAAPAILFMLYNSPLLFFLLFFALSGEILLHSLVELLCGVVSHLFLTMVDCSRLYDDRQVTSRTDRK